MIRLDPVELTAGTPPRGLALRLAWDASARLGPAVRSECLGRWVLEGVAPQGETGSAAALSRTVSQLPAGARVEFEHRLIRDEGAFTYGLHVRLMGNAAAGADLAHRLGEALAEAMPGLWMRPDDDPAAQGLATDDKAQTWPLLGVARPAPTRIWTGRADELRDGARTDPLDAAPMPLPWPTRPLAECLAKAERLPCSLRLVQRLRPLLLDELALAGIHATMQRLRAGGLRCFRPESPLSLHSADPALRAAIIELLQQWLIRPSGWCFDMLIYGAQQVSEATLGRIAREVFGAMPFELPCAEAATREPAFRHASLPAQGLPAVWPDAEAARSRGVPVFFDPPRDRLPAEGTLLGMAAAGPGATPVRLDRRAQLQHVVSSGASGAGKSTLMARAIAEQIADLQRSCGVGVICPHGDLADRVPELVPRSRRDDVLLFDVTDITHAACINPLQGMRDSPMRAYQRVSAIVDIVQMLFEGRDTSGPMLRSNLKHLLLLAGLRPGHQGTLLDAVRALEETTYRDWLMRNCPDPTVVSYWKRFSATSGEHGYQDWLPFLQARLVPFTSNPVLKRMLGRPDSTLNLREAMDQRRIVVCNLSKSVLQDAECRAVGALLLMMFHAAALERADVPEAARMPFHLYVDEFQSFAGDSVGRLFAEARKFGLGLWVSLQQTGQLANRWGREMLLDTVMANTATKIMFRGGPADAETLLPYYRPAVSPTELTRLPDFHAVVSTAVRGRPVSPFVMRVLEPETSTEAGCGQAVREAARSRNTPIAQANAELMQLYDLPPAMLGG